LLDAIGEALRVLSRVYDLFIPYSRGDILAAAHREGEVITEVPGTAGMEVRARLEAASALRLSPFVVSTVEE
jgi:GTP-binding protein HflX